VSEPVGPKPPWTVAMPDEQPEDVLEAAFRKSVDDAVAWASTEGKRDQVMNALYDVLMRVEPDVGEGHPL
jgi:hypothetical protein